MSLRKLRASKLISLLSGWWLMLAHPASVQAVDRALLVGVSEYPQLQGKRLPGPVNDLRLMSSTLARLGWQGQNVYILSEAGGPTHWPTRANILAALADLASQAHQGDWIVVYFSGHGSQVPQSRQTRAQYREPDDLDEVFLPRDTSAWDPDRRVVVGAISDDEINAALSRITAKGASVWAIFDTCHAGDMLRAAQANIADEPPVWRYVSAEDLQVPPEELTRPFMSPSRRFGNAAHGQPASGSKAVPYGSQRWVGFFASQANEGAAEESLPDPDQPQRKLRFGVFTHLIHQAASQWRGSFADLAAHLKQGYRDRPFPTPAFHGQLHAVPRFATALTGTAFEKGKK